MNLSRSSSPTRSLIALALALALSGSFAAGATEAQPSTPCETLMGDANVTAAIESRLRETSRIQADDIAVVVVSGVVELRGVVRSDAQKLLAEQMTRDTRGVDHLYNQLDVVGWVPVTDFARAQASRREDIDRSRQIRSDTWITTAVENTLALSRSTDNCRIIVHTRDGAVVLQGVVATAEARRMAVELAAGTHGVRSVDAAALLLPSGAMAH